jgi:methionyl-tRNA synthetase
MPDFPSLFYSPYSPVLLGTLIPLIALAAIWSVAIKGYALWIAARNGQLWWFVAILIINTVGILDLVYLLFFSPKGSNRFNRFIEKKAAENSSA